jgi:sterol desaturase/sphingolipid hydroxylase (fatty acid hydroxylase superfamily)
VPPAAKPTDSILLRHKRDSYYLAITVFVFAYLFPIDEAEAAFSMGRSDGVAEYIQRHWHWIGTIVLRDLALCTIIYGGYHKIMYEGLGRIAIDKLQADGASPKYNPKWPTADDVSRERFYNYCGWLQLAAYECIFVHLWASGTLDYHRSFFSEPGSTGLSLQLTLYHLLHIIIVPYWRDFHFFFVHRGMHPWWNRNNGLLQGDLGAFLYRHVHSLHHKSVNPGPWSGLAMHPVEHTAYFSCALLPLVFKLHPVLFLFNLFHAAISPMAGHDGLSGEVGGGGYGHYLHHAHFEVNYGTVKVPLDRLFGCWTNEWPRSKSGALAAGLKEYAQISVPALMLAAATALAPAE